MATITAFLSRLEQFNAIDAAGEAMVDNKEQIVGINQYQMYELGQDAEGNYLKPYVWREYAEYKFDRRGKSIVDLYETGAFQSRMNLRVNGDEFEISSSDPKTYKLVAKYGKIFGLTEEGKKTAWHIIRPDYITRFKQALHL